MKIVYYVLLFGCMMMTQWPLANLGNKIDPFIFGMPYSIAWAVIWITIGCVIALFAAMTNFNQKGGKE